MERKDELINYLNNQVGFVTVRQISRDLGISIRTIQTYIKQIKEEFPDMLCTGQNGIKANFLLKPENQYVAPRNFKERKAYILRSTLLGNEEIDMYDLSDKLCISYTTLQNEIIKIRKEIEKYNLLLRTKGDLLFIDGKMENKKNLISTMIYNESQNSLISLKSLNELFPEFDAEKVRSIILEGLEKHQFYIDEFSLINLLLHILINMDQTSHHLINDENKIRNDYIDLNHHFIDIVEDICLLLTNEYNVSFNEVSKYQFSVLLMTRAIRNTDNRNEKGLEKLINHETNDLLYGIIQNVKEIYDIDLDVNEFKVGFSLHLKNMLIRLREQVRLHNPLLDNIKTTSPFIYDIAVYISNFIQDKENVKMFEDEIAYIALHVGSRIEEIKTMKSKLHAVFICPQYYAFSSLQLKKVESVFHDDLVILYIITNPEDLSSNENYDFIISTVPLNGYKNVVLISNFFDNKDRSKIQSEITRIKAKKKSNQYKVLFEKLFIPSLFFVSVNYENQKEAISIMGNELIKQNYVKKDYLIKLFEREKISPTNFGKVAIPHPIDFYAPKTIFEVSILKNPILWGDTSVNIIFMLVVSKEDYPYFQEIFSFLASVCMDTLNLERIINCKSYEEFLKTILELFENN